MSNFLKSGFLFTGGFALGGMAATQAILKAMHSKDDVVRDDALVFESRGDAEQVLDSLDELIETYGIVSVADLYDLVGLKSSFNDTRFGWTSFDSAVVVRGRYGYLLKLPKAIPLK